jgi:hypothetical protein
VSSHSWPSWEISKAFGLRVVLSAVVKLIRGCGCTMTWLRDLDNDAIFLATTPSARCGWYSSANSRINLFARGARLHTEICVRQRQVEVDRPGPTQIATAPFAPVDEIMRLFGPSRVKEAALESVVGGRGETVWCRIANGSCGKWTRKERLQQQLGSSY